MAILIVLHTFLILVLQDHVKHWGEKYKKSKDCKSDEERISSNDDKSAPASKRTAKEKVIPILTGAELSQNAKTHTYDGTQRSADLENMLTVILNKILGLTINLNVHY